MTQIVLQIPETVTLVAIVLMQRPIAKAGDQKPTYDTEAEEVEEERKSA